MTALLLENEAWAALERIYDPCSVATRSPLNIVDMGLVREVEVDEEHNVRVSICPTSPSCMLMASITEGAEKELRTIEGAAEVEVRIDSEFFWTPEAMTERGQAELVRHRAARSAEAPVPLGRLKQRTAT
ncbi:MAG TPA: metal-sulfur cluster assembly factor [Solirubrobacterales bacterium]|nr:metal-sulfur cluster assembly factor [Solirubrobacterales bacterium]